MQEARLAAITRLGELAGEHGAGHILVAGDVLKRQSEDISDPEHEIAALALQRLYVEHMKLQTKSQ